MELIERINTQTNVYVDIENLVQYLFIGWDRILTREEKQQLAAKFPHARKTPLAKFFENALLDAADNCPQTELKIINRQQAEEPVPAIAASPAAAAPLPDTAPPAVAAPPAESSPAVAGPSS